VFARIGRAVVHRQPMRGLWSVGMQRTGAGVPGRWSGTWVLFAVVAVVSIAVCSAVGVFVWRTVSPERTISDINTADPAVGFAFYAALEAMLNGGETAPLHAIVTNDFVDHDGTAGTTLGFDELTSELSTIGASFPHARIFVESIDPSGDSLIARLSPATLAGASVAELTIAPIQIAGGVEVLRIRHGRVSERWATRLPPVQATTFATGSTTSYTGGPTDAWLYRMEVPPGGALEWVSGPLSAVMVEAGTLSLKTSKEDDLGTLESDTAPVPAGEATLLAHDARVRFQSGDTSDVQVLLLDARSSDGQQFTPFKRMGGATSKLLWHTEKPFQPDGPWRLEIGRLELPAGMEIGLANPSGVETVLGIERAPVHLSIADGTITHLETSYSLGPLNPSGIVDASTAAQLTDTSAMQVRGSGSIASSIWVMTFGPMSSLPSGEPPDHQPATPEQGTP
jgi:hypothetical protein